MRCYRQTASVCRIFFQVCWVERPLQDVQPNTSPPRHLLLGPTSSTHNKDALYVT